MCVRQLQYAISLAGALVLAERQFFTSLSVVFFVSHNILLMCCGGNGVGIKSPFLKRYFRFCTRNRLIHIQNPRFYLRFLENGNILCDGVKLQSLLQYKSLYPRGVPSIFLQILSLYLCPFLHFAGKLTANYVCLGSPKWSHIHRILEVNSAKIPVNTAKIHTFV